MSGETDLGEMLASISVERRPGEFCFVVDADLGDDLAHAQIREVEGVTSVVHVEVARSLGIDPDFTAAWLTLRVHSSLEAVGLTAAVSTALASERIACNVIAGYFHDHILVPAADADRATATIEALGQADERQQHGAME